MLNRNNNPKIQFGRYYIKFKARPLQKELQLLDCVKKTQRRPNINVLSFLRNNNNDPMKVDMKPVLLSTIDAATISQTSISDPSFIQKNYLGY